MFLRIFAFMRSFARNLRSTIAVLATILLLKASVWAAPAKPQMQITGSVIHADL